MKIQLNMQKGVGLIEVLVATVVVSLGLLSIASMQGNFLSTSGENKAKAEAQIFAEQKIEELRNIATEAEYIALVAVGETVTNTDTKSGKNAEFGRSWTIVGLSDPDRKDITVTVTWPGGAGVTLGSQISWNMVGNASIYSSTGGGGGMVASLPSPSSDAAIVEGMDTIDPSAVSDGYGFQIYKNDEGKQVVADPSFDNGTDKDGGTIPDGRQLTCKHVCLSVKGKVYLPNLTDFNTYDSIRDDDRTVCSWEQDIDGNPVNVEDTSVGVSEGTFHTRNYICYFGGDCASEPDVSPYLECPSTTYIAENPINIVGGWRGNIGIVGFTNPTTRTLCFVGQVAGVTRRNYKSTRTDGGKITQEGINKNFECHDFLMIDNASSSSTACNEYILETTASRVNRELDSVADNNISTDTESCSTGFIYTVSGSIIGGTDAQRAEVIISVGGVGCETGVKTGAPGDRYLTYSCVVSGTDGDTVALGVSGTDAAPFFVGGGDVTLGVNTTMSGPSVDF